MRALTRLLSASLLAILGLALGACASSAPAPLIPSDLWWPVASAKPAAKKETGKAKRAKVQRIACPELSASDKAVLTGAVERPTDWVEKGATKGGLQAHVDALELGQAEKVAAAKRVIAEHERCRGEGGKAKGKSP